MVNAQENSRENTPPTLIPAASEDLEPKASTSLSQEYRLRVWPLPFSARDGLIVLFYGLIMVLGIPAIMIQLALALSGQGNLLSSPFASAMAQTFTYLLITTIVLWLGFPEFKRSLQVFRIRPKLAWGLLPVFFIGNFLFIALVGLFLNGIPKADNQTGLENMFSAVPLPVMAISLVICAPIVEEYVFRHILIGKLGYVWPVWLTLILSALTFTLLHALAGWPENPLTLLPYFAMGISFGVIYLISGRSFVYSAVIHALHNLVALIAGYASMTLLPGSLVTFLF